MMLQRYQYLKHSTINSYIFLYLSKCQTNAVTTKNTSFLYSSLNLVLFSPPLVQMSFFLRFATFPITSFS